MDLVPGGHYALPGLLLAASGGRARWRRVLAREIAALGLDRRLTRALREAKRRGVGTGPTWECAPPAGLQSRILAGSSGLARSFPRRPRLLVDWCDGALSSRGWIRIGVACLCSACGSTAGACGVAAWPLSGSGAAGASASGGPSGSDSNADSDKIRELGRGCRRNRVGSSAAGAPPPDRTAIFKTCPDRILERACGGSSEVTSTRYVTGVLARAEALARGARVSQDREP